MNISEEVLEALGANRRVLNLGMIVSMRGGVAVVAQELYVSQATLVGWIKVGSIPKARAPEIARRWNVPVLMIHDPWAGGPDAAQIMHSECTLEFCQDMGMEVRFDG